MPDPDDLSFDQITLLPDDWDEVADTEIDLADLRRRVMDDAEL